MTTNRKTAACNDLRAMLKPGETVYTIVRHVSASGMMRVIDLYVFRDNEPRRITWAACEATGATYNRKHDGMRMDGCGMDMCFAAVYNLGQALWPQGTEAPHGTRNGQPDTSGGYALKQRSL